MDENDNKHVDNVELPEDENLEEAKHDPANAEKQSIDATDKADDKVKKAPARKGDNTKQDPMPKTKSGMLNAMYGKMAEMDKKSLMAMYTKMSEDLEVEFEEDAEEVSENVYDHSEELSALVESEATLSEEFKEKSAVIFEAALNSKVAEISERLEDEYQTRLDEELEATRTDLVEKVDSYLNYVVENWMEENKLAVETGLRTEIAEDFMNSLKDLFVESYIDVPETKVDLVDELASQVEELEESVNSRTAELLEAKQMVESLAREKIIRENSNGLAETEVEKLNSLVESLDFEDEESFSSKVKTVRESYFKKNVSSNEEEITEDWDSETKSQNPQMQSYLSALRAQTKK